MDPALRVAAAPLAKAHAALPPWREVTKTNRLRRRWPAMHLRNERCVLGSGDAADPVDAGGGLHPALSIWEKRCRTSTSRPSPQRRLEITPPRPQGTPGNRTSSRSLYWSNLARRAKAYGAYGRMGLASSMAIPFPRENRRRKSRKSRWPHGARMSAP